MRRHREKGSRQRYLRLGACQRTGRDGQRSLPASESKVTTHDQRLITEYLRQTNPAPDDGLTTAALTTGNDDPAQHQQPADPALEQRRRNGHHRNSPTLHTGTERKSKKQKCLLRQEARNCPHTRPDTTAMLVLGTSKPCLQRERSEADLPKHTRDATGKLSRYDRSPLP